MTTEGERGVLRNLQRKADQADAMFSQLVAQMNRAIGLQRGATFNRAQEIPSWL